SPQGRCCTRAAAPPPAAPRLRESQSNTAEKFPRTSALRRLRTAACAPPGRSAPSSPRPESDSPPPRPASAPAPRADKSLRRPGSDSIPPAPSSPPPPPAATAPAGFRSRRASPPASEAPAPLLRLVFPVGKGQSRGYTLESGRGGISSCASQPWPLPARSRRPPISSSRANHHFVSALRATPFLQIAPAYLALRSFCRRALQPRHLRRRQLPVASRQ